MGKRVLIGVTGGLATGKTTVSNMFVRKGAVKIDADVITHELLENDDKIIAGLLSLFGKEVLSGGRIDRKKLSGICFRDKKKLKKLNDTLHPVIIKRIKFEVKKHPRKVVVIDAPLLIEAGLDKYVDVVVLVTAALETQLKRAVKRGIPLERARMIIENQMPLSRKKKAADHIIDGDKSINTVKKGVARVWGKLQETKKSWIS